MECLKQLGYKVFPKNIKSTTCRSMKLLKIPNLFWDFILTKWDVNQSSEMLINNSVRI